MNIERTSVRNLRSPSRLWVSVAIVVAFLLTANGVVSADEAVNLEQLVADLSSDSFIERVRAQRKLTEIADENIESLARAALETDFETVERIVRVLEIVFLSDEGERGELAELALEELRFRGGRASVAAGEVLQAHAMLRESRARKAIEALGGEFIYFKPDAKVQDILYLFESKFAVVPEFGVGFGPPAMLQSIYLHEDWKGTADDLWHLRRLTHHQNLSIYCIRGNEININQLFFMARFIRGVSIHERGACLGIQGSLEVPCTVKEVVKDGAADQAGLEENDVITQLGETPIRSFAHLVEELKAYEIGDALVFEIQRPGVANTLSVKVKLGSWRDVSRSQTDIAPTPPAVKGPLFTEEKASSTNENGSDAIPSEPGLE